MAKREKTDFCDACYSPWYPRILDQDGDRMENICDDCADLIADEPAGLREADERAPICACGVTMELQNDENPDSGFVCENPNCTFYGMEN